MCPIDFTPTDDGCCINNNNMTQNPPSISYTYEDTEDVNQLEAWNARIQMRNAVEKFNTYSSDEGLELIEKLRKIASEEDSEKNEIEALEEKYKKYKDMKTDKKEAEEEEEEEV